MQQATRPERSRRFPRRLAVGLLVLLGIVVALAAALALLWRSESGIRWALARVPGLEITAMEGRPTGGVFAAERLVWTGSGLRVAVDGLSWREARWRWRPHPGAWIGLTLEEPRARRVQVTTTPQPQPQPQEPARAPTDLRLPLALHARGLHIDSVQIDAQPPLTDVQADLLLGDEAGTVHRIEDLALSRAGLAVRGRMSVGTGGDLPVDGRVDIRPQRGAAPGAGAGSAAQAHARDTAATVDWRAQASLGGTLQRIEADAELTVASAAGAQARATVTPFADFPLAALTVQARDVDLSALVPALPTTRLSGHAELESATEQAVRLRIELDNAAAGAWDEGRLPIRALEARAQADLRSPHALTLDALRATLGGTEVAGRLEADARWQGAAIVAEARLADVRPARLDGRLPPMSVEGPVTLRAQGLRSPLAPAPGGAPASPPAAPPASVPAVPPAAPGAAPAPASPSTAPSATSANTPVAPPGAPPPQTPMQAELQARLQGSLLERRGAPAVDLRIDAAVEQAAGGDLHIALPRLLARAGDASLTAAADAQRGPAGAWQVQTQGELTRFDPAAWWPALDHGGPHALDGRWQAQLRLPAVPDDLLAALRGQARFTLDDSRYAGIPVRAEATLEAGDAALRLQAELHAGANRADVDARLPARDPLATDARVQLRAPALQALRPLLALAPDAARPWIPEQGALTLQADVQGRWPALRSSGSMQASDLRAPSLVVGGVDARWRFTGLDADAASNLDLQIDDLAQGERRLDRLDLALEGTPAAHRLSVRAASPLRPPEWTEALAGGPQPGGSRWRLALRGGWQPDAPSGGQWSGTIEQLRAAPRRDAGAPWLAANDIGVSVRLDAGGRPVQARLAPGRAALLGGALHWQAAEWEAGAAGSAPRIALEVRVDPLRLGPLLARVQPQFGWQGDLAVGAHVDVRSGERFDADVVVERAGGDLSLVVDGTRRPLGLTDLRVALAAHDGTWHFTQALAGERVGVLGGAQTLRAPADAAWPPPDAPLQGGLELRVPDLGVWGPWLPSGWRLGGRLRTSAYLEGSLGAPRYGGEIVGDDLEVRQFFQGITLRDGALSVALRGEEATIERFVFRDADDGELRIDGGASFGTTLPQARLRAEARGFRVLDRVDRRVTVSGSAEVALHGRRAEVDGRFVVEQGLIDISQAGAPQIDDDVIVVNDPLAPEPPAAAPPGSGPPAAGPPTQPAESGALAQADVDVHIDLGKDMRVRGRGIDALLGGELHLTTEDGELALEGTVRILKGTYTAYSQNLAIDRGEITFTGDVANPRLEVLAVRPDVDVRVGVMITGEAANPRVRLFSEPEMPEMDKLTWIVTGRAPEGLGRDDTALLQRAALALLAGEDGGGPGIAERLGLDKLSVRRAETGDVGETVVGLGKQLSDRMYVGYERALAAAGGSWQLIYRVARRYTLRARTGTENALDLIWTWRWD